MAVMIVTTGTTGESPSWPWGEGLCTRGVGVPLARPGFSSRAVPLRRAVYGAESLPRERRSCELQTSRVFGLSLFGLNSKCVAQLMYPPALTKEEELEGVPLPSRQSFSVAAAALDGNAKGTPVNVSHSAEVRGQLVWFLRLFSAPPKPKKHHRNACKQPSRFILKISDIKR